MGYESLPTSKRVPQWSAQYKTYLRLLRQRAWTTTVTNTNITRHKDDFGGPKKKACYYLDPGNCYVHPFREASTGLSPGSA